MNALCQQNIVPFGKVNLIHKQTG